MVTQAYNKNTQEKPATATEPSEIVSEKELIQQIKKAASAFVDKSQNTGQNEGKGIYPQAKTIRAKKYFEGIYNALKTKSTTEEITYNDALYRALFQLNDHVRQFDYPDISIRTMIEEYCALFDKTPDPELYSNQEQQDKGLKNPPLLPRHLRL